MELYHNSFLAMGSRFNAVFLSCDQEVCEKLFRLIQNEVFRIEQKISYFNPESEVFKINRTADKTDVNLDEELFGIIETCIEYSKLTFGAYDITLRPIIENLNKNGGFVLTNEDVNKSHLHEIVLNEKNKSIFFKSEKVKIDFGGFGKGYALEKIKHLLDNSPIQNVFISFGESSILAKGQHPSGKKWQVGIKDLGNYKESVHVFELSDESISSSSNYYLDDSGQICRKINVIDPTTFKPADQLAIACVKSYSPLQAEILSTAFLVMNDNQIYETLKSIKGLEANKIYFFNDKSINKNFNRI